ncbi:MAG TPA: PilZ domain-containing protein [Candidatus Methylomirabilis sp.]|nr:PilZ domain-containing protein [Candidatus Methylomirabilis sp.]
MPQNYSIRLRCPYGDMDSWIILENRSETLEEVLGSQWDFECDAHGVQREIPMEAKPVGPILKAPPEPTASPLAETNQKKGGKASGEGEDLQVPVVVYGWSKNQGTFHEETTTLQANASGALVPLNTKLEVGESCFLLNRETHKEREIRVVHVDAEATGETRVGVAFAKPEPDFWKATRREPRKPAVYRVQVSGLDSNQHHFAQTAYTVDVSNSGARLSGVSSLTRPGQVIEVKRRWHGRARYRVVWLGQIGLEHANEIGICCLEPEKNIWGVLLPEDEADEASKHK